jgi:adenylosuccinate synthase
MGPKMIKTDPKVTAIVGLCFGDESKAKVAFHFLGSNPYDYVAFASGGPNKGHAIHYNGERYVLHQIPCGVLKNVTSIIGAGCVVDVPKLIAEALELERKGISVLPNLKIAYNAHIITKEMLGEDAGGGTIGSTSCGIMPAYRAKYGRTGIRAEDVPELKPFLIDTVTEFNKECNILVEGAQGTMLCPDWGDRYPFVTSSPPTVSYALHSLGIGKCEKTVVGCVKAYNTYVGNRDDFQPEDDRKLFERIVILGNEKGNTSGRVRKINWNDFRQIKRAIDINGVDTVVVSKMDILQEMGIWRYYDLKGKFHTCIKEESFKQAIIDSFPQCEVRFSYSPERI